MRRLILLRHAKSDWSSPGANDHDRTLAERGRKAAPRIGAYLADHAPAPDCVLVSTARRTRETWGLVAEAFARPPQASFDERLYGADPQTILAVIRETAPACRTLLVIAHNPGLHEVAGLLAQDGCEEALGRLAAKFPTAALACIDLPIEDWADLRPGIGRLAAFVTPRLLADAV